MGYGMGVEGDRLVAVGGMFPLGVEFLGVLVWLEGSIFGNHALPGALDCLRRGSWRIALGRLAFCIP